jgi:hypothetical protein
MLIWQNETLRVQLAAGMVSVAVLLLSACFFLYTRSFTRGSIRLVLLHE